MKTSESNKTVRQWLAERCGDKVPIRAKGYFNRYSTSRTSACWGQPPGGIALAYGIRIAVCQPSIRHKGDTAVFLYDYIT